MSRGPGAGSSPPAVPRRRVVPRMDPRFLPPVFITLILAAAHLSFGILEAWQKTAVAILAAIGTELLVVRLSAGRWPHPASAYITGISAGILVRSPFLWPYAFASMLSILSKPVLRYGGRHLWNPSNFGICAVLFLAPQTVSVLSIQWGNAIWPMVVIWVLGFFIVWRVGRLHISAAYVAAFFVFATLRSLITGHPWLATLAPITGPMYQLFIFFMVTDPKTTVRSRRGQVLVVVAVAFVEALLRLGEVIYAPFYALFLVGPVALVLETRLAARSPAPPAPAVTPG